MSSGINVVWYNKGVQERAAARNTRHAMDIQDVLYRQGISATIEYGTTWHGSASELPDDPGVPAPVVRNSAGECVECGEKFCMCQWWERA